MKGYKAKIHIIPSVCPLSCEARLMPYFLIPLVNKEVDRLVSEGIVEPFQSTDRAAPIVRVLTQDKVSFGICGDF